MLFYDSTLVSPNFFIFPAEICWNWGSVFSIFKNRGLGQPSVGNRLATKQTIEFLYFNFRFKICSTPKPPLRMIINQLTRPHIKLRKTPTILHRSKVHTCSSPTPASENPFNFSRRARAVRFQNTLLLLYNQSYFKYPSSKMTTTAEKVRCTSWPLPPQVHDWNSAFFKRAPLPPIDLSSIIFEDEEDDEDDISSSTSPPSPASNPISSSPVSSSSTSSSSTIPSSASCNPSTTKHASSTRKFLEPTDHSTDFFWPMGIRPLELRAPPSLIQSQAFVPNNNGIDEILNGPGGQVAPATRPPNTSPKWDWEPKLTMMKHVWTIHHHTLEPTDSGSSFLWPLSIRPLNVVGPSHCSLEKVQAIAVAVAPDNNNNDIDDEIIMKGGREIRWWRHLPNMIGDSSMTMMMAAMHGRCRTMSLFFPPHLLVLRRRRYNCATACSLEQLVWLRLSDYGSWNKKNPEKFDVVRLWFFFFLAKLEASWRFLIFDFWFFVWGGGVDEGGTLVSLGVYLLPSIFPRMYYRWFLFPSKIYATIKKNKSTILSKRLATRFQP